jgi:putative ABC transport system permease protein
MLSPRWQKVIRDLWLNKLRTLLVVLAIAVGTAAFGMMGISQAILTTDLQTAFAASNPAHITMSISPFDDDLIKAVEGMREVQRAEAQTHVSTSLEVGPGEWVNLELTAVDDYDAMQINRVVPVSGSWPPGRREVVFERSIQLFLGEVPADRVHIEMPDGQTYDLQVGGLVHNIGQFPSNYYRIAFGYVTFETLAWMGGPDQYDTLNIQVTESNANEARLEKIAALIRERIEREGYVVANVSVLASHWAMDTITPMVLLLGIIGLFCLGLSASLVINTISAILTQQTRQVGMMKAVGARGGQVMEVYLTLVVAYGLLALIVAVPLGIGGAWAFSAFFAKWLNFDILSFRLPVHVLALQILVAVATPVLASLAPLINGVRVTPREALSFHGLPTDVKLSDQSRSALPLPRPLMLSMRNTLRRKGRLILTLITLTAAGAMFISVFNLHDSLVTQVERTMGLLKHDLAVWLAEPVPTSRAVREGMRVPGVVNVEVRGAANAQYLREDGSEGGTIAVNAVPPDTPYIDPPLIEGRWLQEGDGNVIVVTGDFFDHAPELGLGSTIRIKIGEHEEDWEIVGVLMKTSDPTTIGWTYVPYDSCTRVLGLVGQADFLVFEIPPGDENYQYRMLRDIEDHFKQVGLHVQSSYVISQLRATAIALVNILIILLLIMAVLLGVVGGLSLTGTMSLNVLERTREIGVMRAIGASSRAVWGIVVTEGVLIGLVSTLLGAIVAVPVTEILARVVGVSFIGERLPFKYEATGLLIWLGLSVMLSALASFLPARRASRMSVREALAYE